MERSSVQPRPRARTTVIARERRLAATSPLFRDETGAEVVLGPREIVLVKAVLGLATSCRGQASYQAWLHVHLNKVVVEAITYVGTTTYTTAAPAALKSGLQARIIPGTGDPGSLAPRQEPGSFA